MITDARTIWGRTQVRVTAPGGSAAWVDLSRVTDLEEAS